MAENIEIKAHARDFAKQCGIAEKLSGSQATVIRQKDIFFNAPNQRLKLRLFEDGHGELIAYSRSDAKGPKSSQYEIYRSEHPDLLEKTLTSSLGKRGIVEKTRLLYMVGQTRIHMDEVRNLGRFAELEVVLKPEQSREEGRAVADRLMAELDIREADLISKAYIDLL